MDYKNFIKRSISAAVLVPIFVIGVYWSQWFYTFYFSLVFFAAIREFSQMFSGFAPSRSDRALGKYLGLVLFFVTYLHSGLRPFIPLLEAQGIDLLKWLYLFPIFVIAFFIKKLYSNVDMAATMQEIFFTLFPILYIAAPFSIMHFGVFTDGVYSPELLLITIFGVWANDTGAYLFGSFFGKHKFFERISRNKTWEGVAGGLLFTVASMYACSFYCAKYLSGYHWFCLGAVVSVSSIYGDLFESMIKRAAGVKDSGSAIPGHGGVLDRIDSFLFAIVCVVAYVKLFEL